MNKNFSSVMPARAGQSKKAINILLFLFLCLSPIFAAPCGDVNSSGKIDIIDALMTAQYYVGLNPANFDSAAAEVNGDGAINIVDALFLAQYYVGLISSLPGCNRTPQPTNTPVPTDIFINSPVGFATLNGGTTGGSGGATVSASSYSQLKSYAESSSTYIIMVNGTISNGSGGGSISVKSNKSLIGVGSSAYLSGVALSLKSNNIIIQNLKVSLTGLSNPRGINDGDAISITGSAKNVWIDHCELFSEDPDVQTNIDKYDGLIDIRDQTGFITISWCYLHDHHKGGLVGSSDTDLYSNRKITWHHNYYNKVKLRVPHIRGAIGHFFNNYIVGAKDASEIRNGACVRVERNYYEALHYSIYTPSDYPGRAERIDNIEVSRTARAYPADCTADIPYNYSHVLTINTEDIKTIVPKYAGVGKL